MDLDSSPYITHYSSFHFSSIPSFPANHRPVNGTCGVGFPDWGGREVRTAGNDSIRALLGQASHDPETCPREHAGSCQQSCASPYKCLIANEPAPIVFNCPP